MDIVAITNRHLQLYPHFVKNISQFPIGTAHESRSCSSNPYSCVIHVVCIVNVTAQVPRGLLHPVYCIEVITT